MRFKHYAVNDAKMTFLVRLSYIITRLTATDITQKDVALLVGCSPSQISAIRNCRTKAVTIETLMRVSDALRLTYTIEYRSVNGKVTHSFKMESAIDYMATNPVRSMDTGLRVVHRKASAIVC